jgi:uncharacterized protein (DUF2062 family)
MDNFLISYSFPQNRFFVRQLKKKKKDSIASTNAFCFFASTFPFLALLTLKLGISFCLKVNFDVASGGATLFYFLIVIKENFENGLYTFFINNNNNKRGSLGLLKINVFFFFFFNHSKVFY